MPKIKEVLKLGIKEPYIISFSTRIDKFLIKFPKEVAEKYGKRNKTHFDTIKECNDEIDSVHNIVIQEEILLRKVIYITMQTSNDEKVSSLNHYNYFSGNQGLRWSWFVLDEYQVGSKLMYKVIEKSTFASININKIDILPQLMMSYRDGKIIILDFDEILLDKIKEIESQLQIGIIKIKSFFNVENDEFKKQLLSMPLTKLLNA